MVLLHFKGIMEILLLLLLFLLLLSLLILLLPLLLLLLLLLLRLLLLLLPLQSLVSLGLFQNCPPLFSFQQLMSSLLHAHLLWIILNWPKPPQLTFSYTPSAVWFKKM
jgi:hypothetical protein